MLCCKLTTSFRKKLLIPKRFSGLSFFKSKKGRRLSAFRTVSWVFLRTFFSPGTESQVFSMWKGREQTKHLPSVSSLRLMIGFSILAFLDPLEPEATYYQISVESMRYH